MTPGVRPLRRPKIRSGSSTWSGSSCATTRNPGSVTPAEARRLQQDGFISLTGRHTAGPESGGITNLHLFATAQGAQDWMTHELSRDVITALAPPNAKIRRFTVAGIPGAAGYTSPVTGNADVGNVVWVQGRCLMVLG